MNSEMLWDDLDLTEFQFLSRWSLLEQNDCAAADRLGRQRLQRSSGQCSGHQGAGSAPRNRQANRRHERVRGAAAPLGGRANLSWFGRNRRLDKDWENLADTLRTFVTLAAIQLALRRLARK